MLADVTNAKTSADLFGPFGGPARAAKRIFRVYATHLHPDRAAAAGFDPVATSAAFDRLTFLYQSWTKGVAARTPHAAPTSPDLIVVGRHSTYTAAGEPTAGTVSGVYRGAAANGDPVAIKIPRSATSSRFIEGERTALAAIAKVTADSENAWLAPYFPTLLDTATLSDGAGTERAVNVLGPLGAEDGFVDLATVAAQLGGLDGRDWAWIHRRLLRAIAGAHLAGVVHGAIVAENVLIQPEGHGVVLAGWSLSTTAGQPLPGRIASRTDAYPPDADEKASPALDVYMAHALMRSMLAPTERRQLAFARGCMQPAPTMRPDAAGLLGEYDELLEDLYGRRRFRRFPYTVSAA
ncbi:hypothetical protein AXK58_24180 [Tsukamurella tyrosinosolvens]|nr:hypothetical protein AXK58_24180 [Tsukamurella tyrosinosolvens]